MSHHTWKSFTEYWDQLNSGFRQSPPLSFCSPSRFVFKLLFVTRECGTKSRYRRNGTARWNYVNVYTVFEHSNAVPRAVRRYSRVPLKLRMINANELLTTIDRNLQFLACFLRRDRVARPLIEPPQIITRRFACNLRERTVRKHIAAESYLPPPLMAACGKLIVTWLRTFRGIRPLVKPTRPSSGLLASLFRNGKKISGKYFE